MADLTFFGGVGEIGGNKILVQDEDTRIFLDFGRSFGKEKLYYEEPFLTPREEKHLLNLGLLPPIKGLYKDSEEPPVNGIFISHPHLDHWGYTCYVDNRVPLYCGETTKNIILNYEYVSSSGPSKDYYLANFTKDGKDVFKEFRTFRTGDKVSIGPLRIEPVHVDHSIPGAYGFIVHTSSETIAYTGDFRTHGPKSRMTEDFINKATLAKPDILITEATNLSQISISTEDQVKNELKSMIKEINPKTIIPIHTERPLLFKRFAADLKSEIRIPFPGEKISSP